LENFKSHNNNYYNNNIINMAHQDKHLKAFIRLDGKHRPVSGTTVLRLAKPKVGKWKEVLTYLCCTTSTTSTTSTVFQGIQQVFKNSGAVSAVASCGDRSLTVNLWTRVQMTGPDYSGIVLYADQACTLPIGGNNQWWLHEATNTAMFVNTAGTITIWTLCA
jgi:hypothetical protein